MHLVSEDVRQTLASRGLALEVICIGAPASSAGLLFDPASWARVARLQSCSVILEESAPLAFSQLAEDARFTPAEDLSAALARGRELLRQSGQLANPTNFLNVLEWSLVHPHPLFLTALFAELPAHFDRLAIAASPRQQTLLSLSSHSFAQDDDPEWATACESVIAAADENAPLVANALAQQLGLFG
jgi:hypothetical protein